MQDIMDMDKTGDNRTTDTGVYILQDVDMQT